MIKVAKHQFRALVAAREESGQHLIGSTIGGERACVCQGYTYNELFAPAPAINLSGGLHSGGYEGLVSGRSTAHNAIIQPGKDVASTTANYLLLITRRACLGRYVAIYQVRHTM